MTPEPPRTRRMRTRRANGQGSVFRRADGWWVGAAYVLMADGTRRRRVVYGQSEAEAARRLVQMQARSDQGIPAEATGWTLERFLNYWLDCIVAPARKPRTHQGYGVVVRVHLIPALGRKRLNRAVCSGCAAVPASAGEHMLVLSARL